MLRADLNRAMADGASPAASRDAAEAAAERATREVSGLVEAAGESERAVGQGGEVCEQVGAQYEAKLGEIEGAMRELISQNRALKARGSREAAERQPRGSREAAERQPRGSREAAGRQPGGSREAAERQPRCSHLSPHLPTSPHISRRRSSGGGHRSTRRRCRSPRAVTGRHARPAVRGGRGCTRAAGQARACRLVGSPRTARLRGGRSG